MPSVRPLSIQPIRHAQSAEQAEALLNEKQTAKMLAVTPRALQAWRYRGGGPAYVRISSRVIRYRRCDLYAWIASKMHKATSEYSR